MGPIYIAFIFFLISRTYNYLKPSKGRKYTSLYTDEAWNELKEKHDIILLDVRGKNEYNDEHIKNTRNIPLDMIEKSLGRLPRDKDIIVY
jgi:phage shock protein E